MSEKCPVNPKFQYSQQVYNTSWDDQVIWLNRCIGKMGVEWDYFNLRFYFKTQQDKLAFVLRWG